MSSSPTKPQFQTVLGRRHHAKNTVQLTESITAELASEGSQNGCATKSKPWRAKKSKTTQNCFDGLTVEGDLDDEGSDYASPLSLQSDTSLDSDHESNVIEITNKELAHLLPSKMVLEHQMRYKKWSNLLVDEFEEYLKLPQEDFDLCNPIQ
ncbi:hypothetical protein EDB19DRAFT_1911965 [Suillus lakei]|nr:hypothetical protein EDB19DRAFT_1911965 [Suillus lakei]